ncbi:MAG: hypothetical protein LIO46_03365, partial [Clostridiales bacterium]|nr:hypothetical protein [Clostridiales bacterium]
LLFSAHAARAPRFWLFQKRGKNCRGRFWLTFQSTALERQSCVAEKRKCLCSMNGSIRMIISIFWRNKK